jgi:glyoxylase-like metal-dependent hydrolase (beta-lactamase superfamily II)
MPVPVYQVVYPDHTLIIDTGMDRASFAQMFGGSLSAESYDQIQSAMRHCQTILLTHEHLDHIAGLSTSAYLDELLPKLVLSREQLYSILQAKTLTPEQLANLTPLDYGQYHSIAPGMVLVKAAGHSPGSQMVYLRLQNGSEFLLVGDVVWSMDSLTRLKGRPLFMSLMIQEDIPAIRNQARLLHDLIQTQPIHLLISHDYGQFQDAIQQGLIGSSLE